MFQHVQQTVYLREFFAVHTDNDVLPPEVDFFGKAHFHLPKVYSKVAAFI